LRTQGGARSSLALRYYQVIPTGFQSGSLCSACLPLLRVDAKGLACEGQKRRALYWSRVRSVETQPSLGMSTPPPRNGCVRSSTRGIYIIAQLGKNSFA